MKRRLIFFVLLTAWICGATFENICAEEPGASAKPSIQIGEHLAYKITWLKVPIAVGDLWVKERMLLNGREVIHVVGVIETNRVLRKILPMHDEVQSWIDAETLESVQFEKEIDEIKTKLHQKVVFDRKNQKGHSESLKTGEKKEFNIKVPTYDVLSVVYWARGQSLESGKSFHAVLTEFERDWALELKVLNHEKMVFQAKEIDTFRVEPNTVSAGVTRKGFAYFNVTNDSARLPIRGVYKAPFGSIVGTLIKAEDLKSY